MYRYQMRDTAQHSHIEKCHGPRLSTLQLQHTGLQDMRLGLPCTHTHHLALLPGSFQTAGSQTGHVARMTAAIGTYCIIIVTNVVKAVAFESCSMSIVEKAGRTFGLTGHRVNLSDVVDGISVNDINATIVIDQEAGIIEYVMVGAVGINLFFEGIVAVEQRMIGEPCYCGLAPWSLHVSRRIDEATIGIAGEKYVELASPMTESGGPLSLAVAIAAFHVEVGIVVELWYHVGAKFPVHQVLALEDGDARQHMHRSGYKVEGVAHLNHVRIGHIGPKDRIGECAVAIV